MISRFWTLGETKFGNIIEIISKLQLENAISKSLGLEYSAEGKMKRCGATAEKLESPDIRNKFICAAKNNIILRLFPLKTSLILEYLSH